MSDYTTTDTDEAEAPVKSAEQAAFEQKIVETARRRYKLVCDAEADQRQREREDLLFQIPENQWSDEARKERGGSPLSPPRPMMSISLLAQPKQLVWNQFVKAQLGVNIHPVSEDADQEGAEVRQGLYRRIERDSNANQARGWALLRVLNAGRGWYRVNTQYDEDTDPTGPAAWDQEITIERILHQESVYMDPSCTKPDCSDGKWAFVVADYSHDDFALEFPHAKRTIGSDREWSSMTDEAPEWVKAAGADGEPAVQVAEYWYKEIEREEIVDYGPGGGKEAKRTRSREKVRVMVAKISGYEVLEEPQEWNGRYIPLIPVYGNELIPVDGERRFEGMTRPARHGQQMYNYAASNMVERMASEPKTPFVGYVGQFASDKPKWDTLNLRNYPYVEVDPVDVNGAPASIPQRAQLDMTGMSIAQVALGMAKDFVQATTAVYEPALGELPSRNGQQSGRAIQALQSQTDAGTSQYIQNLAGVSMRYEAMVVDDLMAPIYDRPGRITRILTGEDDLQSVMLGQPFVRDAKGYPRQAKPGQEGAKHYDLRKGKYSYSVDIGKSHQTRMEAGQAFLTEVIGAQPDLMGVVGDLVFKFRDEPGAKEIAERLKKTIAASHPGLLDDKEGSAEQAQAQVQALTQQNQQMQQQLQQAGQIIQTKQVEQQAKVQIAQIQAQVEMAKIQMQQHIAEMNNAGKIEVSRISAAKDTLNAQAAAAEEEKSTGLKIAAEMANAEVDRMHEQRMQHQDHAHEVGMAAAGGRTLKVSRDQGQDSEREEGHETNSGASEASAPQESAE